MAWRKSEWHRGRVAWPTRRDLTAGFQRTAGAPQKATGKGCEECKTGRLRKAWTATIDAKVIGPEAVTVSRPPVTIR
jgi:hypothetical protein